MPSGFAPETSLWTDPPADSISPARYWRWFFILLAFGIVLRVFTAFYSEGIWTYDEHQQYMEQAYRWLHGYGVTFWEQERGLRHPSFCVVLGSWLFCLEHLGIHNPLVLAGLVRATLALTLYAGLVLLALSLYRRGHAAACLFLMFLFAVMLDLVYLNARTLTDNAIILPLCLALVLWDKRPGWAGLSLGLMFGLRLQSILFSAGFWQITAFRDWWYRKRHPRLFQAYGKTVALSLGLLIGLLLMGYWDFLEYGRWFHSAVANIQANLIEDKARLFGIEPFLYYIKRYERILFQTSVFALPLLVLGIRRAPGPVWIAGVALLAHSLIGHKEERFLWGMYPLLCVAMALGFEWLWSAIRYRRALVAVIVASFLVGPYIRFAHLPWKGMPFTATANLLQHLNDRRDVHGVAILKCYNWESGNCFYLRQPTNLYYPGQDLHDLLEFLPYEQGVVDFLIMPRSLLESGPELPYCQVKEYRGWVLLEKKH
jgi:hypothetical protein